MKAETFFTNLNPFWPFSHHWINSDHKVTKQSLEKNEEKGWARERERVRDRDRERERERAYMKPGTGGWGQIWIYKTSLLNSE